METRITPELHSEYIQNGYWTNETLGDYFSKAIASVPDKIAVVDPYKRMTYGELGHLCTNIINGLSALGIGCQDRVAYQLPNLAEGHAIHNALRIMGAIACPVITIFREKEIRFILNQTKCKAIFIPAVFGRHDFINMYSALKTELSFLEQVIVLGDNAPEGMITFKELLNIEGSIKEKKKLSDFSVDPDDVCSIYFTSGTTSEPKGVQHTNQTLLRDWKVAINNFKLNQNSSIFMPSTIGHLTGLAGLEMPIMLGAKAVYLDVFTADDAAKMISREACDFTVGATPFLQWLVESDVGRRYDLSTMKNFICGGAYIPSEIIKKASIVGIRAVRSYGMTESPSVTLGVPEDPEDLSANTDGKISPGMRVKIIGEDGKDLPPGREGEILVTGPETFIGYTDPRLNQEAFGEDGFFHTGDMGYIVNNDYIVVSGRKKDIIIRGGENISVKEIEDTLYQHPAIEQAAVVAMPDKKLGEKACAYVKVRPDCTFSFDAMMEHFISNQMSTRKIPERLEIINALPMNASGKILKTQLRKMIAEKLEK